MWSYRATILTIGEVTLLVALTALLSGCGRMTLPSATRQESGATRTTARVMTTTAQVATTTFAAVTTTNAQPTTTATASHPLTTAKRTTSTVALAPGKEYERIPTNEKVVALTFDAAYDPSPLRAILAALHKAGANGTFFLTGEFLRDFPKSVAQIVAAGFPIGNHSYTHPDFTKLTDAQIRSQLSKTASAIVKAGAEDPSPLFRPPSGARNKHVLAVLRSAGYVSVYWSIDTLDWENSRTPEEIEHAVLSGLKPGAIILMHVGSNQTASILPTLLEKIKAQGYSFVTLREALPSSVK
jgi:peptidoglycan-N-acetylglucosamine deacetylase